MCRPCREAGFYNADRHYARATELHAQCPQRDTCTCQHHVGPGWVNYDLIAREADTPAGKVN